MLEQTIRDEIRGRRLLNEALRDQVIEHRRRGAFVQVLDDGGLDDVDPALMEPILDRAAEAISRLHSDRIIIRTAPKDSDKSLTVVAITIDATAAALGLDDEGEEVDLWLELPRPEASGPALTRSPRSGPRCTSTTAGTSTSAGVLKRILLLKRILDALECSAAHRGAQRCVAQRPCRALRSSTASDALARRRQRKGAGLPRPAPVHPESRDNPKRLASCPGGRVTRLGASRWTPPWVGGVWCYQCAGSTADAQSALWGTFGVQIGRSVCPDPHLHPFGRQRRRNQLLISDPANGARRATGRGARVASGPRRSAPVAGRLGARRPARAAAR